MDTPRCWRCGSSQPYSAAPYPGSTGCVYCGAQLTPPPPPPPIGRVRWTAHPPPGAPSRSRTPGRAPYQGPPRYWERPRWGFAPSVWIPSSQPVDRALPDPPLRDLGAVAAFARATAVFGFLAAGFESWRYVLLVRGRTQVLSANEVRANDALVTASGWATLLMGVVTAISFLPALARATDFAARRAHVQPSRQPRQRLLRLLVPGWNLYGAGVVVAEVDAALRLDARSDQVIRVGGEGSADQPELQAVHRRPARLVTCWWAAWVLNGLIAAAVVVRDLVPGTLQSRADLVELHVVLDLTGAVVALLTAAVVSSWIRLLRPSAATFPAGWIIQPQRESRDQPSGSGATPSPTTESVSN